MLELSRYFDKFQIAGTVSIFSRLLPINSCRSAAMSFSTTSYLAGVGSVIAALTIGFSGGFFIATPPQYVEQNRLQRVTSSAPVANPAPQAAVLPKPAITEARVINMEPPPPAAGQPTPPETIPVMAKAVDPEPTQALAKPEPVRAAIEQDRGSESNVNAEKLRIADAKAAERKRNEARKFAERRKQREIGAATVAVKRMLRDRDPQQVADGIETPRFGFFGQD
jgi:type IV secretory pathway VirB10-like protein